MPGARRICDAAGAAEQMKASGGRPLKVAPDCPGLQFAAKKKPTDRADGCTAERPGTQAQEKPSLKPRTDNEVLVSRRKISHIFVRKPRKATSLAAFEGLRYEKFFLATKLLRISKQKIPKMCIA